MTLGIFCIKQTLSQKYIDQAVLIAGMTKVEYPAMMGAHIPARQYKHDPHQQCQQVRILAHLRTALFICGGWGAGRLNTLAEYPLVYSPLGET